MQPFRAEVEQRFRYLRDRIVAGLGALEPAGAKFNRRAWQRPGGGGGEMSELRGQVFEKGGCNFSAVWGDKYPAAVEAFEKVLQLQPSPQRETLAHFYLAELARAAHRPDEAKRHYDAALRIHGADEIMMLRIKAQAEKP